MRFRAALLCLLGLLLVGCSSAGAPADAQTSPEKVVMAFYDLVDADQNAAALELVAPDAQTLVQGSMDEMEREGWDLQKVEVISTDGNLVKISLEILVDGEIDSGTDDVVVVEQDGKWWIAGIPM